MKHTIFLLILFFTLIIALADDQAQKPPTVEPEISKTGTAKTTNVEVDPNHISELGEKGEKHQFQAEINQLLGIIINSLYTDKEIFLRELISNASDALDKIRFLALTDKNALATNEKLEIKIKADPKAGIISIRDTGIGMTKDELVNNLGTIAKSGTKAFLEKLKATSDYSLIGQFGVGFYSAYIVADKVTVVSKSNNGHQYIWTSSADNSFSVARDPRGDTLGRGTEIILHLKPDLVKEYTDEDRLRELIEKYNTFSHFPIYLWSTREEEKEVPDTEAEEEKKEEKKPEETKEEKKPEETKEEKKSEETKDEKKPEETKEDKKDDIKVEKEKKEKKPKMKKVKETIEEWVRVNDVKPIWTRPKKEIKLEEYNNFFKAISKDYSDPLTYIHFSAEGTVSFKSILYVPSHSTMNLYDFTTEKANIRLYVRRVFVTDAIKNLIPRYLNFIYGIVDSEDLPLHISRQALQEDKIFKNIQQKLVSKAIEMMRKLAEKEKQAVEEYEKAVKTDKDVKKPERNYTKLWNEFGKSIRLGIIEDAKNRKKLIELLRYYSSKSEKELVSLKEYVSRMKPGQKQIYYIAGQSIDEVKSSPLLEELKKRGYEVLYFIEPIDEYIVQHIFEYDGKRLQSIAKQGVELEEDEEEKKLFKEAQTKFQNLTDFIKDTLGSKIDSCTISNRINVSPCVLVAPSWGVTANQERIMKAQALADNKQFYFSSRKIMEINYKHPVIIELNRRVLEGKKDETVTQMIELLYETALLRSGYSIENQEEFANKIFNMMKTGLHIDEKKEEKKEETTAKDEL